MMLSSIPVVGWIMDFVFKASLAFPFWICWTVGGIGKKFFYWIPTVYQTLGFWEIFGIFICVNVIGIMIKQISPFSISQTNTNNNSKKY